MGEGFIRWNLTSYLIDRYDLGDTYGALWVYAGAVLLCMVVPYLLGSLNFGLLISRKHYHDDIRTHGSGNAGTTNMLRTYGKKAAVLTLIGDMLKAAIAVAFGYLILSTHATMTDASGHVYYWKDEQGAAIAGLFVMLGHMFPCFYHFKGGKGVATAAIVILMINPLVFLCLLFVFIVVVAGTKFVSLGSIMGICLYPIFLTAFSNKQNPTPCALSVVMAILIVFMHRENIKRIRAGRESKLSFGKKKHQEETEEMPVPDEADTETGGEATEEEAEADAGETTPYYPRKKTKKKWKKKR